MKQILIPTDFSDNSWNAIQYTLSFFKDIPIHIYLVHVAYSGSVDDDTHLHSNGLAIGFQSSLSTEQRLDVMKQKMTNQLSGAPVRIDTVVQHSLFVDGLKTIVREKNIDLIVMGTKGASGIKEVTVGSHTGAVITRVKCPILVIPEHAVFVAPKNIVFPTDFNIMYKQRVLESLLSVAKMHNSSIKVLRVASEDYALNSEQEKHRYFLSDALQPISHSFHWVKSPDLEEGLQSFIDIMNIQIIAMVAKNINFFQRLLFKPTVEKISYHTNIPFFVLHD